MHDRHAPRRVATNAILFCLTLMGTISGCRQNDRAREQDDRLTLSVTDTTQHIERRIARGLQLEVRRQGTYARAAGWDVAVYATGDTARENLLYHSREWHGPYPTQVYAWSEAENYFGKGARELPVRGHPWLVLLECVECVTEGTGDVARFTRGELKIEWRPIPNR
jgi:hypothetical protein